MSAKTAIWIVILILVVLGVWYFWGHSQTAASPSSEPTTSGVSQAPAQNSGAPASADTSDQSLNAGLSQIDTQTQSANQSSASVDQRFNDTAVQQSHL